MIERLFELRGSARFFEHFLGFLSLPLVGCSETAGAGGGGGSAGNGGAGGDGGANTASVVFSLFEWDPVQGNVGPAVGVEICETGTINCVQTDDDGAATVEGMPVDQEVSSTLDKDGLASYLDSYIVPAAGFVVVHGMATEQRIEDMHGLVMSPYPMVGTGMIFVDTGTLVGATFTLVGTPGKAFYRDVDGNFDPDLMATTTFGGGGFLEVSSPGEYEVEIGGTADNCVITRGWAGDSDNTVKLPIQEGYMSTAIVNCQ